MDQTTQAADEVELNGLAKFDEIPRIDSTMFVNMPAQYFAFRTSADSRSPYFPANSAAIGVDFGDGYLPSELLYTEYFRTSHLACAVSALSTLRQANLHSGQKMKFNHAIKRAISTTLTVSVLVACSGGGRCKLRL